ncbi:hypothetical protein BU24DRAFT_457220 [Aaosphaeria arxii CBS 175.79]|uniref:Uncharacterized protein n=1 Tax=Aaosphaeria arxii CBS 175.79 TaxID=1450172 RepID=A0A6A5Y8Z1_9PLEO|nr:uncharacterized protein BU24DRAFT_457220 [Aaosphaeria arxii CBS 175.79]KAF2021221.1 hypothetical protein BU24DRAFT_457220 [Aaosphaeria arxii CBS 175.79]
MVDVAVSAQLQQWSFEKPSLTRPDRSDSSASSPDPYNNDPETLRIDTSVGNKSTSASSKETVSFQERYLSSEEDLSPMEGTSDIDSDYGDDVSIHNDDNKENCFSARKMSMSRFEKGKSCDMAVLISYVSAGRPKVINLANVSSPVQEQEQPQPQPQSQPQAQPPQRSASLAQLPFAAINKLRKAEPSRLSMAATPSASRTASPAPSSKESRRPSTGHQTSSRNTSSFNVSDSSSFSARSTRSISPAASELSIRPVSAMPAIQPRSSLYISSSASVRASTMPFPPLTPQTPGTHAFLSSDPYENSTTSSASPIIKSAPHKRLRSISQKLSLAKIAITPSTKKWDTRVNGKPGMPPTPASPFTPVTPQTAPLPGSFSSSGNRLRRHSRISRPSSVRGPSPEIPAMPTAVTSSPGKNASKMVARGAGERAPTIELPPFPEASDPMASIKGPRIRKRKSLMDLL